MRELPTGTVTFLFTDVEGSTRLLHELGPEPYAEALAEHRRFIREACAAHDGVEVDTQGDSFFFAFPTAPGALDAAAALASALADGPIRVRAGVHTGTPVVMDEGYVGADVHRAARIAAAGHGGQVLVSAATAALVERDLRELGEHRFKDLSAPERVYQLGEGEFPPLKSLYRTNVPVPATPFLGRERELAEVLDLLAREDVRQLTLTGPGGTGKTRLALQAAAEAAAEASDRYPDGVWWVPLAPLRSAELVVSALAHALDVPERAGRGLSGGLGAQLAGKRMLVVLDNAEHLLPDVAAEIARLRDVAGPEILVTSRERLQLQGEHVYSVPTLTESDAIDLFAARAGALGLQVPHSRAVSQLCARLDNLPLALELAASRTVVFPPEQLLERLSQRLDLLKAGRDADPRQQTLRATIEWSYDLLDPAEQRLFRTLSAFAGGCTYEAAEAVCEADADTLQSLLDKSLLRRRDDPPRYWMLETIREYAADRLVAEGEYAMIRRRHAEYFHQLAISLGLTMETLEVAGGQRHDIAIAEQNNFRAAIEWARESDLQLAVRVAFALENFWVTHDPVEGIGVFDAFLERERELPTELRAAVYRCRGNCTIIADDRKAGVRFYEKSLEQYRRLGDERRVAMLEHRIRINDDFEPDERRRLLHESLDRFRELGLRAGEAQALAALGWLEWRAGNLHGALDLITQSAELASRLGFAWTEQQQRDDLAILRLELGDVDDAARDAEAGLALARRTGDRRRMMASLVTLARALATPDPTRAGRLFGAAEAEHERRPMPAWEELLERRRMGELLTSEDGAFESGRDEGRLLSLDEAVKEALGES